MSVVRRAPLVPSGSFTTWTMMSCPCRTSSAMLPTWNCSFSRHRHTLGVRHDIGGVQESRLVHADIDERRLHTGQHPTDLAFVDIAHDAALGLTLDMHFLQQTVFDQSDPGFGGGNVNQQFYRHK